MSGIFKKLGDKFFKLINLKDDPNTLAKSMSLGFGLALLPLPGMNIPLGMVLAKLLRLNIAATTVPALLLTYVSPFLYVLNYKVGTIFINSSERPPREITYDLTFWQKVIDFFAHAGPAYLLGSAVNALLAAVVSYFAFLLIFKNAGKILTGKTIKLTRVERLRGFRAYICPGSKAKALKKAKEKEIKRQAKEEKGAPPTHFNSI